MFVTDIGKRNWIDSANQKENYGKCDLFCDSFHYMLDNAWPWKDIGSVDETWRPNAAFIKCGLQTEFWICIIYRPRKHFLTIHFESVHTSNLCTPQWVVESSSIRNASVVNRKTNHSLFQLALNTFFSFSYQAFPPDFGAPWWSGQCPHQCPPPSRNSACAKVLLHFHKHIFLHILLISPPASVVFDMVAHLKVPFRGGQGVVDCRVGEEQKVRLPCLLFCEIGDNGISI